MRLNQCATPAGAVCRPTTGARRHGTALLAIWLTAAGVAPVFAQATDPLGPRSAQGSAAMQAGNYDEAIGIYEELVAARPTDPGLLLNLGMARYMAGRAEAAIPPLQKATKLRPSLAPAALFLGASLLEVGRLKEAASPLQQAVTAMPQNGEAREMLARVKLSLSEYPSAATHYRALTTLDSQNPKAWYGLSRSYQGIAEEAFAALQQQAPDSPLLGLLVAEVAMSTDKFPAALAIYRRGRFRRITPRDCGCCCTSARASRSGPPRSCRRHRLERPRRARRNGRNAFFSTGSFATPCSPHAG